MPRFEAADNRLFKDVWVCRKCKATIRGRPGVKPEKCRKCGSKSLRLKHKVKKS